jgi:hypothetical protein
MLSPTLLTAANKPGGLALELATSGRGFLLEAVSTANAPFPLEALLDDDERRPLYVNGPHEYSFARPFQRVLFRGGGLVAGDTYRATVLQAPGDRVRRAPSVTATATATAEPSTWELLGNYANQPTSIVHQAVATRAYRELYLEIDTLETTTVGATQRVYLGLRAESGAGLVRLAAGTVNQFVSGYSGFIGTALGAAAVASDRAQVYSWPPTAKATVEVDNSGALANPFGFLRLWGRR